MYWVFTASRHLACVGGSRYPTNGHWINYGQLGWHGQVFSKSNDSGVVSTWPLHVQSWQSRVQLLVISMVQQWMTDSQPNYYFLYKKWGTISHIFINKPLSYSSLSLAFYSCNYDLQAHYRMLALGQELLENEDGVNPTFLQLSSLCVSEEG